MHGHDQTALHIQKVGQHPVIQLRRENLQEGNLPDFPAELFFTDILKEVQEKRYGYDACVYAQFARLIVQLLRFWLEQGISFDTDQIPEVEEEAMQNVLMYIDDHSQENINIESLARTYHMSYSYFARQFRKYYGQSCKQYIEFVRLSKVENLLLFSTNIIVNWC